MTRVPGELSEISLEPSVTSHKSTLRVISPRVAVRHTNERRPPRRASNPSRSDKPMVRTVASTTTAASRGRQRERRIMQLGMIGLGRMGANIVRRLMRDGHDCVVYDVNADSVQQLAGEGATGAESPED